MKTHPPCSSSFPARYHGIGAAVLMLATAPSHAGCGNGNVTITNLPSLGGSYYVVTALNAAGQIAGYSLSAGDLAQHAFRFGLGGVTDLGTLGGSSSFGMALNDSGLVAGESLLSDDSESHGFLYDGTALLDLGNLGGISSTAKAINNAGQVTGDFQTIGSTVEAFLYANDSAMSLGHLGGFYSRAAAINQSGHVVGNSVTAASEQHAFLYTTGAMVDLGSLGGGYSDAFAVNDQDVVVGESYLANGELHGFIFANGGMTDLGTLGGTYSSAAQINNAGEIIGRSRTTNDAQLNGFIYRSGVMTDLGTLGGSFSAPNAINSLGQVVGQAETADGSAHAFLWQSGTMVDLNTLLPANSGWELAEAQFINDSGRIVGTGTYNGQFQWFALDLGGINHPPVANAGPDLTSECSTVATLDGTQSSDPDGDALRYEWSENGTVLGTDSILSASFSAGHHTITLKVSDPCGENSLDSVSLHVGDTTPPQVTCPPTVSADTSTGTALVPDVRSIVVANDNCTPADLLGISQTPAAGTVLGPGLQIITVTVTDASGNATTSSTTVTSGDTQPPVIVRAPRHATVSANSDCQGQVPNFARFVIAHDNVTRTKSLVITQSPAAGSLLDKGEHVVVLTVTDAAGNSTSRNAKLKIADQTPPVIHQVKVTPDLLTPANGKIVQVTVSVKATDNCDAAPRSKIVRILCDETTARQDITITGDLTAELAASNNPRGNGRTYTLVIVCEDSAGNKSHRSVTVCVPKPSSPGHHRN